MPAFSTRRVRKRPKSFAIAARERHFWMNAMARIGGALAHSMGQVDAAGAASLACGQGWHELNHRLQLGDAIA